MRPTKVLLIDLDPSSGLGGRLLEILAASFTVRRVVAEASREGFAAPGLAATFSDFEPDVNFLVLSPGSPELVAAAFQDGGILSSRKPFVFVFECREPDEAFALLKLGAADFITPPLKAANVLPRVWRLLEQNRREESVAERVKQRIGLKHLVGESPAFLAEVKKLPLVAKCDASVLICGETGTGKEVYARAIHYLSPRAGKPFIPVNCGAIPVELLENELFGHERGAFTGAATVQPGLLQEAEGGTLFLDEIDCLPPLAQIKLLRFIQEKEYRRLGSTKTLNADVRVIAASNVNFELAVQEGKLRQDFYYRLSVIRLNLPPLRERRDDIPLLACHFLRKYAREFRKEMTDLPADVLQALQLYDWPGNVRELEHVIERVVVLSEEGKIESADLAISGQPQGEVALTFQQAKAKMIEQFEKAYIQRLLSEYHGNITDPTAAVEQIRWEYDHLRKASAILFWFPREALCPFALYELGAWSMTNKPLFVGVHPEYERRRDIEIQTALVRPEVRVMNMLNDLVELVQRYGAT